MGAVMLSRSCRAAAGAAARPPGRPRAAPPAREMARSRRLGGGRRGHGRRRDRRADIALAYAQAQAVDLDLQVDVVDPVHDFENPINVFVRQIGEFCFHHKHPCSLIGRRRIRRAWPGTA
ncbi:hypothetical protein F9R70_04550 [Bordetella pertussis]